MHVVEVEIQKRMGLTWSNPKKVNNNTKIMCLAPFPEDKKTNEHLWTLWKRLKDHIKMDGFQTKKVKDKWFIMYNCDITEDSDRVVKVPDPANRANIVKMRYWQAQRSDREAKWTGMFLRIVNLFPEFETGGSANPEEYGNALAEMAGEFETTGAESDYDDYE